MKLLDEQGPDYLEKKRDEAREGIEKLELYLKQSAWEGWEIRKLKASISMLKRRIKRINEVLFYRSTKWKSNRWKFKTSSGRRGGW